MEALDPNSAATAKSRPRDATFGKATAEQMTQWERSYFLNTGQPAPGTNLTLEQLKAKYGNPHIDGNQPPNAPSP